MTTTTTTTPAHAPAAPPLAYASLGNLPSSSWRAAWALYLLTLRQHLHGKRWMVMALLFLLPGLIAILARSTAKRVIGVEVEFLTVFMFIPQALLPLVALLYGSGLVQDELEEQTITYLLIRPIPRWAMYLIKLLATVTTTTLLTAVFTSLTYAALYAGRPTGALAGTSVPTDIALRCLRAMSLHALAVLAYTSLFGLISLLTRWSLIVGIVYALLIEGILANLPLGVRLVTVIYHARIIAYRTMSFVFNMGINGRGRSVDMAAEAWQLDIGNDPTLAEHPQVTTSVSVLVFGSLACALLAAFLCTRKEFHVKTPEKN